MKTKGTFTVYRGTDHPNKTPRIPAFFTSSHQYAAQYGDHVQTFTLTLRNPTFIDAKHHEMGPDAEELPYDRTWLRQQKAKGHDGLIVKDGNIIDYVAYAPNQFKQIQKNTMSRLKKGDLYTKLTLAVGYFN